MSLKREFGKSNSHTTPPPASSIGLANCTSSSSTNSTSTSKTNQIRGYKAGDLVYSRDYGSNHRWTAAVVSKRHGSMVFEVEVGNEKWIRQQPQPAKTKTFRDFWSSNRYPLIHTARYLWPCWLNTLTLFVPRRRINGSPSFIGMASRTLAATDEP